MSLAAYVLPCKRSSAGGGEGWGCAKPGAVEHGLHYGNVALSSRGASLPAVTALHLPSLSPRSPSVQMKALMPGEETVF